MFSRVAGARKQGKNLTCVFCRAAWIGPIAAGASSGSASASLTSEGYINLGNVAGLSPIRDTSSCKYLVSTMRAPGVELILDDSVDYQGPRKGRRYYGFQDYEGI